MSKKKARKVVVVAPKVCERRANLTMQDVARVSVETTCDRKTVISWMMGRKVQPATASRIIKACRAIGIETRA